jgi:hypothetical protein
MTVRGVKAGCLGIDDDFPHRGLHSASVLRRRAHLAILAFRRESRTRIRRNQPFQNKGLKDHRPTRIQFGALPYRFGGQAGVEVLLVTSRETGRWLEDRVASFPCEVQVFALLVKTQLRKVRWLPVPEAAAVIDDGDLRKLILQLKKPSPVVGEALGLKIPLELLEAAGEVIK